MRAAVKTFISDWVLPPKVLDLVKNPRRLSRYSGSYNKESGKHLDQVLEPLLPAKGYYVDIGANDGVTASNTRYFEKHKGWRGVLIEPIMHQYFACRRNRSTEQNVIVNAACVSPAHKDRFLELVYSDTMTVSAEVDGAEEHARKGLRFTHAGEDVVRFCAPALTLTAILDQANAPKHIDLMSLDVEGGEIGVLEGLDFDRYTFGAMVIESNNVGPLTEYLQPRGYKCKGPISERDWLFSQS